MELRDDVTVAGDGQLPLADRRRAGLAGRRDRAHGRSRPRRCSTTRPDEQIKSLLAKGAAGGLFFATDDVQRSYEELKSRGVEFQQEPTEQPYGIDAGFRDPSGNQMRMAQLSE